MFCLSLSVPGEFSCCRKIRKYCWTAPCFWCFIAPVATRGHARSPELCSGPCSVLHRQKQTRGICHTEERPGFWSTCADACHTPAKFKDAASWRSISPKAGGLACKQTCSCSYHQSRVNLTMAFCRADMPERVLVAL